MSLLDRSTHRVSRNRITLAIIPPTDPTNVPVCEHQEPCPSAKSPEAHKAKVVNSAYGATQCWTMLCNGVIRFEEDADIDQVRFETAAKRIQVLNLRPRHISRVISRQVCLHIPPLLKVKNLWHRHVTLPLVTKHRLRTGAADKAAQLRAAAASRVSPETKALIAAAKARLEADRA